MFSHITIIFLVYFEWADMIIVMEDHQRTEISKRFPRQYIKKQILNLDIPDIYKYNQPELIEVLKENINGLELFNKT